MRAQNKHDHGVDILIAEDSPTQAEHLRYLLNESGHRVTLARNGKEALAAAHRQAPSLIISDIVMPEMDGYALCREIKSEPALKNIPVILLTSSTSFGAWNAAPITSYRNRTTKTICSPTFRIP
jgi:CheY-like chemotaxis protein